MPFQPGYKAFVMLDGVNAVGTNISTYCNNGSWPQTSDTNDVSAFGAAPKAFIVGQTDGDTVTIGGPLDPAVTSILYAVRDAQRAGSATSTLIFAPAGSVATYTKSSAEVWINNIQIAASVGSNGAWSASLQVTGAVTNSVW